MKYKLKILLCCIGVLGYTLNTTIQAQTCCSGGVPISSNLGLSGGAAKSMQVLLTYDYNHLQDLMAGSRKLEDTNRKRKTHALLLEVGYNFNAKFSTSLLLSTIRQERTIFHPFNNTSDFIATQGVGDAVLLFKYQLFQSEFQRLIIGTGPKIPIGKTNFENTDGLTLPADLQTGSGAWDWLFWSHYSQNIAWRPSLNVNIFATYRYTGTNKQYNGNEHYQFGQSFQTTIGIDDRFLLGSLFLNPLLSLRYRYAAADRNTVLPEFLNKGPIPATGGHWLYIVPGVNVLFSPQFSLRLSSDLPIYRQLEGTQLSTSYKATVALFYTL